MKKLVIFGAGPIGRMLAHVFQDKYQTVFVDVNQTVIERINYQKEFGISVLGTDFVTEKTVKNVRAISSNNQEALNKEILDADLVLTACGMNALKFVAPVLAEALALRITNRKSVPLFIVACENATEQNSSYLKGLVLNALDEPIKSKLEKLLFMPDCMIDRVSLVPSEEELGHDSLRVKVEEYFQLAIKKQHIEFPSIPEGVSVVSNLDAIKKQKLFTVNAVHALVAYYGYHFGYQYIHESLADNRVSALVRGVLVEIKLALLSFGITENDQDTFASSVLKRFQNENLKDQVVRVARSPIRKAGQSERLVSPALINLNQGNLPSYLASGLAALFLYDNPSDAESQEIVYEQKTHGFGDVFSKYSSLSATHPLYLLVEPPFYLGTRP